MKRNCSLDNRTLSNPFLACAVVNRRGTLFKLCHLSIFIMAAQTSAKAISFEGYHSDEELQILRAIVKREEATDLLLECCCNLKDDSTVELLQQILYVRTCSLDVVDKLAARRRRMVQKKPFLWRQTNYLLKMASDLDFLSRSQLATQAMDGLRITKRNPFTTVGGLEQSMRLFWQHDLPEEDDLPVLLDTTSYSEGVSIDEPSKFRLSEWFILLEEKRFGKLSKAETLIDFRMKALIQKEAEFASKKRFGIVQNDS